MTHKEPHEAYNIFLQVAAGKENGNPSHRKGLISTPQDLEMRNLILLTVTRESNGRLPDKYPSLRNFRLKVSYSP